MTLSEFVNTYTFATISALNRFSPDKLDDTYQKSTFYIPRIFCKDGFSISVQTQNGSYSSSNNGYRKFGTEWTTVEWGFPSIDIDPIKYNAESPSTITMTVGSCDISLLDELCNEHGGVDYIKTITNEIDSTSHAPCT